MNRCKYNIYWEVGIKGTLLVWEEINNANRDGVIVFVIHVDCFSLKGVIKSQV